MTLPPVTICRTAAGLIAQRGEDCFQLAEPHLDRLFEQAEPGQWLHAHGAIFGYTVGNDLSSRDIEGENPLYLPQAKVWSQCCALGPGLVVRAPLPRETAIEITISRNGSPVFRGATALDRMKRTLPELAEWLWRDNHFPAGCYLLTGTGVVPPNEFTLASGDEMRIAIAGIGTLVNSVA